MRRNRTSLVVEAVHWCEMHARGTTPAHQILDSSTILRPMATVVSEYNHKSPSLPASLRLGPVHLRVSDVERSAGWYQRSLGLRVHRLEPPHAELGDGTTTVLVLTEDPAVVPARRHAGLYHYAL